MYNHQYFIKGKKSYSSQNQWINAIKVYLHVHRLDVGDLTVIERPRKQQHLPDMLSPGEITSILQNTRNLKHRTLLMLVYSCGLRIGEALALRPSDIESDEGLIYIRAPRGNKDRRVPLSPRILDHLRNYYNSYRPPYFLFEGQKKTEPYSSRSAAQILKRTVQESDITKKITLHTLRHSYATH
jgi:integrase/recombinase XerD